MVDLVGVPGALLAVPINASARVLSGEAAGRKTGGLAPVWRPPSCDPNFR